MSLRNGFLRFLLCVLAVAPAAAQNGDAAGSAAGGPEHTESASPSVLVLKSGRVIRGRIHNRGDGYTVRQASGRMFVASSQVWTLAETLDDAHTRLLESFPGRTPDTYLQMARWCIDQKMWGTARQDVLDALHLDPYREDARRLLARVMQLQKESSVSRSSSSPEHLRQVVQTGVALPRRSLGGLSIEQARTFTRRIQPLLHNTCGRCHHPKSDRSFVLHALRHGSTPEIARRNLDAVARWLDGSRPEDSPLRTYATTAHGPLRSPPLAGRTAEQQIRHLSVWVAAAAPELRRANTPDRPSTVASQTDPPELASGTSPSVRQAVFRTSSETPQTQTPSTPPSAGSPAETEREARLLDDAARRNRRDPFNPDTFNARYLTEPASSRRTETP